MGAFTPTSGASFNADGSIEIGVECSFNVPDPGSQVAVAERVWQIPHTKSYELYGTLAMRAEGKADILARIWLDGRLIFNANLKTPTDKRATENIWVYVPETKIKPSNQPPLLKIHIEAAAAGAGWPVDAELELAGTWQ